MRTQLEREGLDIGEWRPSALSSADVQSAERVVVFDVSLPADVAAKADHWDGLPSVSKDYRSGRDAIASKVDALVAELKREGKERSD